MLSSKEKLNNYLPTLMKHLCWTHTSACLGINSRQCNDKKAINTSRIVHFLEHFKCRPAAANAYFSDLYQPWRNCCPETMNALGMETLSLRQIRQISRIRPNNVLGLFPPSLTSVNQLIIPTLSQAHLSWECSAYLVTMYSNFSGKEKLWIERTKL